MAMAVGDRRSFVLSVFFDLLTGNDNIDFRDYGVGATTATNFDELLAQAEQELDDFVRHVAENRAVYVRVAQEFNFERSEQGEEDEEEEEDTEEDTMELFNAIPSLCPLVDTLHGDSSNAIRNRILAFALKTVGEGGGGGGLLEPLTKSAARPLLERTSSKPK